MNIDTSGDAVSVALGSASQAKRTAELKETVTLMSSSYAGTDSTKVYRLGTQSGFEISSSGKVKVTAKPSSVQKKISMSYVKKSSSLKITAGKGTAAGTTTYFFLYHNSTGGKGKGYQIIKVTAG